MCRQKVPIDLATLKVIEDAVTVVYLKLNVPPVLILTKYCGFALQKT